MRDKAHDPIVDFGIVTRLSLSNASGFRFKRHNLLRRCVSVSFAFGVGNRFL